MVDLRFHHVGIGTSKFERAIETYVALGHELKVQIDDPGINIRVAFLTCPGGRGPWIEILAPLGPNGPLQALIDRRALPSPYHTCYAVNDIEAGRAFLRERGFMHISEPQPALAFSNAKVAFSYHVATGLVELVESPPPMLAPFGS